MGEKDWVQIPALLFRPRFYLLPGGKLDLEFYINLLNLKVLATESEFFKHFEKAKLNTFTGQNQPASLSESSTEP